MKSCAERIDRYMSSFDHSTPFLYVISYTNLQVLKPLPAKGMCVKDDFGRLMIQ